MTAAPDLWTLLRWIGTWALAGPVVVWATDRAVAIWERTHLPVSPSKKRWLSLALPAALVGLGYAGQVLLRRMPLTAQTAQAAGVQALAAAGVKQIAFAVQASLEKPPTVTTIGTQTNIARIDAADDVLLGSSQMGVS